MIGQAFGSSETGTLHASSPKPSTSPSASPSPSPSASSTGGLTHQTAVKGVPIQVLNGSGHDGLGATVAESLKKNDWEAYWLAGDAYGGYIDSENKRGDLGST